MTTNKKSLYDIIVSKENIYNAIYCLQSYIFEKGLLNQEDLKLYIALCDKFDFELIDETISYCEKKLNQILTEKSTLFDVTVYFKIKKFEYGKDEKTDEIKYRPIHTAGLIDQICMVSMLLPLMFDDSSGIRKSSELTKMIPHNFYGNIPGSNVEALFKPWISQYKSYTDNIIEHCKEYRENHRYKTEITLDIKNFFPSISPEFIFKYIQDKLGFTFTDPQDMKILKILLTKLLIFNIKPENLDGWEKVYYGEKVPNGKDGFFSRGIAQGLPQSYFFGNLCMIEIRKALMNLDDFKHSESFFYVDDSVIYIGQEYDKGRFQNTINQINDAVGKIGNPVKREDFFKAMKGELNDSQYSFQRSIDYTIKFHDTDKSEFCRIEDAGMSIAGLEPLMRNASMAASIFSNADEIEDTYSKDKLEKISELINEEINRLKTEIVKKEAAGVKGDKNNPEARLKLLKRYKRFYLYRLRLLERRLSDEITDKDIDDFKNRFKIPCISDKCKLVLCKQTVIKEWFETFDEEIFQSEARMFITMLPFFKAESFLSELIMFEQKLVNDHCGTTKYLFFTKDFSVTLALKGLTCNPYASITRLVRQHISPIRSLSPLRQKRNFESVVKELYEYREVISRKPYSLTFKPEEIIWEGYANFIFANSDEYVRMILNAFYSVQNEIEPSDARSFTKYSSRGLHYTELRILARLRNKNFVLKKFIKALEDIDASDLDNRMTIDMGLLEVINIFISKVRNPEWIDNIVLTHRVVKGLWYNGSKFMNSYTLHNEEHAVTLIKAVVRLVKAIDYLNIKQTDYYILFLACYLHDVSMVIHPNIRSFCNGDHESLTIISDFITEANDVLYKTNDVDAGSRVSPETKFKEVGHLLIKQFESVYDYFSENIRCGHPKDSAIKIREWKDSVLKHLAPLLLSHVAKVSESHGYDVVEVYGLKSDAQCSLVSEKYSMILIRLADLMDVANDRINYNLLRQNVSHMAQISQFHWISHLITDEIQISPTFKADDNTSEPIEKRKIIERLNFNLFINVKFLEATKLSCEKCCLQSTLDTDLVTLPSEYIDSEGLMLEMFRNDKDNNVNDTDKKCPVLCRWMVKKHEWFINELRQLNAYLNAVNDRWFKTEIRFNILYRDDFPLDRDLYDAVYEYIYG